MMNGIKAERQPFSRLPGDLEPLHYEIFLKPDLAALTFNGSLKVVLCVKTSTSTILCNAADLQVTDVQVNGKAISDVTLSEENETLHVALPAPLKEASETIMTCKFRGELNDKMRGFYRSKYTEGGEDRFAAVTQFEATDARRCFPCWDEPSRKATFNISVSAPKNRTILSNMPIVSEEPDVTTPDYHVVKFDKTPKMSTYLVAIVVGEYEYVEGKSAEGVAVRVYTPLGKKEQGHFALESSIKALTFYKDFFGVAYPLKKYDCIAISDFQCGAMENWGLVTFRELAVLVDPAETSSSSKQWIAIVVTHEMAHQWFGNLVTMEWWTHLWLNEGFASFMENTCTHALFPEYDIWTQFVASTLTAALELDALKNSHPIEVEVGHPSEVDEIFDNISYNKGASVIRMLHNYIGNEAFRQGMKAYLTKYSYKNTFTADLWASLEDASQKPVGRVMSTWTSQMGFPLIKVSRVPGQPCKITLSQEKFNADGSADDSYHWNVPIKIITSMGKVTEVLLEDKCMVVEVEGLSDTEWYKVNPGHFGYFRVSYETPSDMHLLRPAIENQTLSEVDRLGLLDDLFALVQAGKACTVDALKLIQAFKATEESYVVWSAICNCLSKLQTILCDFPYYESSFKPYVVELMMNITKKIGWDKADGEHHTKSLLRSQILARMGCNGYQPVIEEARQRFADHASGNVLLPADLRDSVYRIVAKNGDMQAQDQLMRLFRAADLHEEKERLSCSMGASSDVSILKTVLDFSIGKEIRAQDTPFVIAAIASNTSGRDLAWTFFKDNYKMFKERYKSGMLMSRLCKRTSENFSTPERAKEVEEFFNSHPIPAERTIKQSIENIQLNAAWIKRDSEAIEKYFVN